MHRLVHLSELVGVESLTLTLKSTQAYASYSDISNVCIKNIIYLIYLSLEMFLSEPQIDVTSHGIGTLYVFYVKSAWLRSNLVMW